MHFIQQYSLMMSLQMLLWLAHPDQQNSYFCSDNYLKEYTVMLFIPQAGGRQLSKIKHFLKL